MGDITAAVYDGASPATKITDLPDASGIQWLDQVAVDGTGSGALQIDKADPVIAAHPEVLNHDNIVRLAIDGTEVFSYLVGNRFKPPAPQGERAEELWTLSGPGVLAILGNGIVLPELDGTDPSDRNFGWMAISFDDSGWGNAVRVQRQGSPGGSPAVPDYVGFPDGWPDPLAYWIWSRAISAGAMPAGTSYFRTTFTLSADKWIGVVATADNAFRIFLDDEELNANEGPDQVAAWKDTMRADRKVLAGTHTIAIEAQNQDYPGVAGHGPAAVLCSVVELDPAHRFSTNILARSDDDWLALDYPADPPGMPIGQIIRELIEEAQARGALVGVTLDFTDTQDSNGNDWDVVPDIAFPVGSTSVLDAVNTLIEQYIDARMTPTLVLQAYNKTTMGTDLTATVSLMVGEDFELADAPSDAPGGPTHRANAFLVRDATGALQWREDAGSLATRVRREDYAELGTAPSAAAAARGGDALLERSAHPAVNLPTRVTEASGPYTVFRPGDTILAPGLDDTQVDSTVINIAVSLDDAGNPFYDVQLMQDDPLEAGS